jgi:signal transduction histidine kinase
MSPLTRTSDRTAPARPAAAGRAREAVAEVEAECAAMSRLLHDNVMQTLLAARYAADLAGDTTVRDAVREAISEASAAMWRLKPRTTQGHLVRALGELAERRTGVVLSLRTDGVPEGIDPAAASVAYRVVQSALEACAATHMEVRVSLRAGLLTVSVCDDGPAYDDAMHAPDSDLTRWLARAGSLGGSARVGDGPRGGTTLWLEIPDASAKEQDPS